MEESSLLLRLLVLPLLLGINSFFAAAEVALVSVRQTRMRQLAESGEARARVVLALQENPDRLLSAVQLGVTLASLGLGWAGEDTVYQVLVSVVPPLSSPQAARVLHLAAFAVAFGIITFLHMVVGEVVPKNLALERTERLALAVAPALEFFTRTTRFFVQVVETAASGLSHALGLRGTGAGTAHTAEELKLIVTASQRQGKLLGPQEEMLHDVVDFFDLTVRQVMVPRNEMTALDAAASLDQALRLMIESRFSRLPVYEGSPEHVIGILHVKDLWRLWQQQRRAARQGRALPDLPLRALARRHHVVPETKPLYQMLAEFQRERYQMAMVVDEFGTIVGLVTVEDLLEQIVGEIRDEHEAPAPELEAAEDEGIEIEGTTSIRDLENLYDIRLPYDAGFETLAGFLLERLGVIPEGGEHVEYEGRRFTVTAMEGRRIGRVRIARVVAAPDRA